MPTILSMALILLGITFGTLIGLSSSPVVADALPAMIAVFSAVVGAAGVAGFTAEVMRRAGLVVSAFIAGAIPGVAIGSVLRLSDAACAISNTCPPEFTNLNDRQALVMRENLSLLRILGAEDLLASRFDDQEIDEQALIAELARIHKGLRSISAKLKDLRDKTGAELMGQRATQRDSTVHELKILERILEAALEGVDDPVAIGSILEDGIFTTLPGQIGNATALARGIQSDDARITLGVIASETYAISAAANSARNLLMAVLSRRWWKLLLSDLRHVHATASCGEVNGLI